MSPPPDSATRRHLDSQERSARCSDLAATSCPGSPCRATGSKGTMSRERWDAAAAVIIERPDNRFRFKNSVARARKTDTEDCVFGGRSCRCTQSWRVGRWRASRAVRILVLIKDAVPPNACTSSTDSEAARLGEPTVSSTWRSASAVAAVARPTHPRHGQDRELARAL